MSANLAVVPKQSSPAPVSDKKDRWFTRSKDGGIIFRGESYEDHVAGWSDAELTIEGGLWGQARVAASLTTKYGDRDVKRFAHDVHKSGRWIWDMARTGRVFGEKCSQLHYLSFTHHVEAAKAAKDDDIQPAIDALNKAHDGEWSTKELQRYVETGLEPGEKSEIDASALVPAIDMESPADDLKMVADRAMITFLMEARTTISDLIGKCPRPKFTTDVLDSWNDEINDHLEQLTLGVLKTKVIQAWKDGYREESQIASITNIPTSEIRAVMMAYKREGIFEKVARTKTAMAKGTQPWIWHLVGEPIGSDANGREFKLLKKKIAKDDD